MTVLLTSGMPLIPKVVIIGLIMMVMTNSKDLTKML